MRMALFFAIGYVLFAFFPNTFINYGYNYFQFIPVLGTLGVLAFLLLLYVGYPKVQARPGLWRLRWLLLLALPLAFWLLRTRIHCFGGDGAVGVLPVEGFVLMDFIPHGRRLDGFLGGALSKGLDMVSLYQHDITMPSVLSAQIYTVILGVLFVLLTLIGFRKNATSFWVTITGCYVFNFFGNIDSYAFSIVYALAFALYCCRLTRRERLQWMDMIGLAVLWGIGLWIHPFHLFSGFIVAWFGFRFLRARGWLPVCISPAMVISLYGLALFVFIKISKYSQNFFSENEKLLPAAFSVETATHALNVILLPLLPLVVAVVMGGRDKVARQRWLPFLWMSGLALCSFFVMGFTIGAVDQFNYAHLFFFFLMPWVVYMAEYPLSHQAARGVICLNLLLLIPMVIVHSSSRTIQRAEYLYPMDYCHHNRVMSWQTHLGLVLGDNFSENPEVAAAVLRTFRHGAQYADPPQFRGGNYVYYIAFHYNYGRFEEGRALLANFLKQNPQAVNMFFSDRPAFTFFNRKRLWDDILEFYPSRNVAERQQLSDIIGTFRTKAQESPYYRKRPSYAVTEY